MNHDIYKIYYIFNFDILFEAARVEVVGDGPAGGRMIDNISIYMRYIIYSISTFCLRQHVLKSCVMGRLVGQ